MPRACKSPFPLPLLDLTILCISFFFRIDHSGLEFTFLRVAPNLIQSKTHQTFSCTMLSLSDNPCRFSSIINLYVFSLSRTQNERKDYTAALSECARRAVASRTCPESTNVANCKSNFPRPSFLSLPSLPSPSSFFLYTRRRFSSTPENQPRMVSS